MKKQGSALVLTIAVISLLLVLSVVIISSATSTFKTAFAFDYINRVTLAAQSGIEKGMDQLGMTKDMTHAANYFVGDTITAISPLNIKFDNNITCNVTFDNSDPNIIKITSKAQTSDNKYSKTLTQSVNKDNKPVAVDDSVTATLNTATNIYVLSNDSDADNDSLSLLSITTPTRGQASISADKKYIIYTPTSTGTDVINYTINDGFGGTSSAKVTITISSSAPPPVIASPLFSVNRKFMVANVITSTPSDIINFYVKPGNPGRLGTDINFLMLNGNANALSFNHTFIKSNGGSSGVKVDNSNFFTTSKTSNTIPSIKNDSTNSSNYGKWTLNQGIYYYLSSMDLIINNTNSSSIFIDGITTAPYTSSTRIIFVNGNISLNNLSDSFSKAYMNNVIIYCTGIVTLNNSNLSSALNVTFIANNLKIIGTNYFFHETGNNFTNIQAVNNIIVNNINSSIIWQK